MAAKRHTTTPTATPATRPDPPFDPNAAADPSSGIFGLPFTREQASLVVIPVPFEATVSYGGGTEAGPEAIRRASAQIDLLDRRFGETWQRGIFMEQADDRFLTRGREARELAHYDDDLFDAATRGESFALSCSRIVEQLPELVYVTIDIDGLDPSLCPNTGIPVPGGLGFREVSLLLHTLAKSGKRIVGCDLVEVTPGGEGDQWDASVGARVLFRLCMAALTA